MVNTEQILSQSYQKTPNHKENVSLKVVSLSIKD